MKLQKQLPHTWRAYLKYYLTISYHASRSDNQFEKILAGVPQGSVLGPNLYLLYIANIPTNSDSITTIADDMEMLT